MTVNNRVWAVDTPGKRHSPADVRRQTFQTSGGVSGLIAAGGGGVGLSPGVPMSVRLEPCSVVARSEYPGRGDESYSFTVKSPVDVSIRTTGSGGGRTDVVAWVVWDPVLDDEQIAETDADGNVVPGSPGLDPNEIDYWYSHVFENVPSAAARDTESFRRWVSDNSLVQGVAVPYAKVVQGANSTGLAGKVTPFYDTVVGRSSKIIVDQPTPNGSTAEGPFTEYRSLGPAINFDVPWWATRARVKATIQGVTLHRPGGGVRAGKVSGLTFGRSMRQYRYYIESDSAWGRENYQIWADLPISASRRGTTQSFQFRVTAQSVNQTVRLGEWSHMFLEVEFLEDPNAVDNSDPEE